ncbi:hypothetical protein FQR65_LT11943 [Abscondita terminalis]|nr:hypothetical protein FQR65_LT11943 [Abscondita terminalis]
MTQGLNHRHLRFSPLKQNDDSKLESYQDSLTDADSVSGTAEETGHSNQEETPTAQAQQLPEQISQDASTGPQQQPAIIPQNRKRKTDCVPQNKADDLIELVCSRLRKPVSDLDNNHIALTWAHELNKMEPRQQVYAKKFISDIIFEGQMGTLHRNSVTINQPASTPFSYTSFSHSSNDQSRSSSQPPTPYNPSPNASHSQQQPPHSSQLPHSATNQPPAPVDLEFNQEDRVSGLVYEDSRHALSEFNLKFIFENM